MAKNHVSTGLVLGPESSQLVSVYFPGTGCRGHKDEQCDGIGFSKKMVEVPHSLHFLPVNETLFERGFLQVINI